MTGLIQAKVPTPLTVHILTTVNPVKVPLTNKAQINSKLSSNNNKVPLTHLLPPAVAMEVPVHLVARPKVEDSQNSNPQLIPVLHLVLTLVPHLVLTPVPPLVLLVQHTNLHLLAPMQALQLHNFPNSNPNSL